MKSLLQSLEAIDHGMLFKDKSLLLDYVWEKYVTWMKTPEKGYPYLESIKKWIMEELPPLSEVQAVNLKTHIYYAAERYRREREEEKKGELLAAGWTIFTEEAVRSAKEKGVLVIVRRKTQGILGEGVVEEVFRPFINGKDEVFLMKPKARTRGVPVWSSAFDGAFLKLLGPSVRLLNEALIQ